MEENKNFEIDYFSGLDYKSMGLHRHDFSELLFVLEGNLNFLVDDKLYKADRNCVILFKEKRLHTSEVDASSVYTRYNLNFRRKFINETADYEKIKGCFDSDCTVLPLDEKQSGQLKSLFETMLENYNILETDKYAEEICRHILTAILMYVSRVAETVPISERQYIDRSYISDAVKYINDHLTEKLVIEDIADSLFVSRAKLIGDFKNSTGITIGEYITSQRLKKAKKLLSKGIEVGKSASESGFMNTCHFIRTFKKYNGITPLKYAHSSKKNAEFNS